MKERTYGESEVEEREEEVGNKNEKKMEKKNRDIGRKERIKG